MADDPNKRHQDGWTVSFVQTYEYDYFKNQITAAFSNKSAETIHDAIMKCRDEVKPSEGRKKLEECVRRRLSR